MTPERLDQTWETLDATDAGAWLAAQVEMLLAEARAATDPARSAALFDDAASLCAEGLGDSARAEAIWAESWSRRPTDATAAWATARHALAQGDVRRARAALDGLLAGLPEGEATLWARVPLAALLQDAFGDEAAAREQVSEALRFAPHDPALLARAAALFADDATLQQQIFERRLLATRSPAHRARLLVERGARAETAGDQAAAVTDYEAALAADPRSDLARERLVRLRVSQGAYADLAAALVTLGADLEPGPVRGRVRHLAGMICGTRLGETDRGDALLRLSAADPEADGVTARELARLALTAEGAADAFGAWAAEADPDEAAVGAWLQGLVLARAGQQPAAVEALDAHLGAEPGATSDGAPQAGPTLTGGRLLLHLARRRLTGARADVRFFADNAALWAVATQSADHLALATAAGLQAEHAGDVEAADAWYARALESEVIDPQAPSAALRTRIGALWARGEFVPARLALEGALAQGGGPTTRHWLHRRLAELAMAQCPDHEAALRHLRALLTLEPGHGWGGRAFEQLLDALPPRPEEAPLVRSLAEATHGERRASLLVRAGTLHALAGTTVAAERCWRDALSEMPDFLPARIALGASLAAREAWAEVAALDEAALAILPPDDPGRGDVAERLANLRAEHLDDPKGAAAAYAEVLRHRPELVSAWLARIAAAERAGDEAALEGLALAVRARAGAAVENAGLLTRVGAAAHRMGARTLALSTLASAVELDPGAVLPGLMALSLAAEARDHRTEQTVLRALVAAHQVSAPDWAPILAHRLANLLPPTEARALLAPRIDDGEVDAALRSARLASVAGDAGAAARDLGRLGALLPAGSQDALAVLREAAELAERAGVGPSDRAAAWERVLTADPEVGRAWEGLLGALGGDPVAEATARVRFARQATDPRARAHALLTASLRAGGPGAAPYASDRLQEALEADPQGITALWLTLDPGVDAPPPTPQERVATLTELAGRLRRPRDQAMALAEAASLLLESAGRPERAGAWLLEAVRRDPHDALLADRALSWARPRARHGDVAEVLQLRLDVLDDGPERRRLHRALALVVQEGLRDREAARGIWQRIAEVEPAAVDAHLAIADLSFALEDLEAAEAHYVEALDRTPGAADRRHAAARVARLRLRRKAGAAAVEAPLEGCLSDDEDGTLRLLVAEARLADGDTDGAIAVLAPLAADLGGEAAVAAQVQWVRALVAAHRLAEAEARLEGFLDARPDEPALVAAAEVVRRGRAAEAQAAAERAALAAEQAAGVVEIEPVDEGIEPLDDAALLTLGGLPGESAEDALAALEVEPSWAEAPWVEADFGAAFADDDRSKPPSVLDEDPPVGAQLEPLDDAAFEWTGALDDAPVAPSAGPLPTTVLSAGRVESVPEGIESLAALEASLAAPAAAVSEPPPVESPGATASGGAAEMAWESPEAPLPIEAEAPVSVAPVSVAPVSVAPVSVAPVSVAPVSVAPVSVAPGSVAPVSVAPVSVAPVSVAPVSVAPVSAAPVSVAPVSVAPADEPDPLEFDLDLDLDSSPAAMASPASAAAAAVATAAALESAPPSPAEPSLGWAADAGTASGPGFDLVLDDDLFELDSQPGGPAERGFAPPEDLLGLGPATVAESAPIPEAPARVPVSRAPANLAPVNLAPVSRAPAGRTPADASLFELESMGGVAGSRAPMDLTADSIDDLGLRPGGQSFAPLVFPPTEAPTAVTGRPDALTSAAPLGVPLDSAAGAADPHETVASAEAPEAGASEPIALEIDLDDELALALADAGALAEPSEAPDVQSPAADRVHDLFDLDGGSGLELGAGGSAPEVEVDLDGDFEAGPRVEAEARVEAEPRVGAEAGPPPAPEFEVELALDAEFEIEAEVDLDAEPDLFSGPDLFSETDLFSEPDLFSGPDLFSEPAQRASPDLFADVEIDPDLEVDLERPPAPGLRAGAGEAADPGPGLTEDLGTAAERAAAEPVAAELAGAAPWSDAADDGSAEAPAAETPSPSGQPQAAAAHTLWPRSPTAPLADVLAAAERRATGSLLVVTADGAGGFRSGDAVFTSADVRDEELSAAVAQSPPEPAGLGAPAESGDWSDWRVGSVAQGLMGLETPPVGTAPPDAAQGPTDARAPRLSAVPLPEVAVRRGPVQSLPATARPPLSVPPSARLDRPATAEAADSATRPPAPVLRPGPTLRPLAAGSLAPGLLAPGSSAPGSLAPEGRTEVDRLPVASRRDPPPLPRVGARSGGSAPTGAPAGQTQRPQGRSTAVASEARGAAVARAPEEAAEPRGTGAWGTVANLPPRVLSTRPPPLPSRAPADRLASARAIIGRDPLDLTGWRALLEASGGDHAVEVWLTDVVAWITGELRPVAVRPAPHEPLPDALKRGLLPETVPANLLLLLRSVAAPLGAALATAHRATGGRRLPEHEPLAGLVRQLAQVLAVGAVQPQLSEERPYSVVAEAGSPVTLVMGTALFDGADLGGAGFLVARALGPVAEGTLAARVLSDREFRAFVAALLDLLGVRVPALSRDRSTIERLQGWLEPHLPVHQRLSWEPLAKAALTATTGRSASSLRAGLEIYAARLALSLAEGFSGAMEMLRLLDFDDRPRDRIGAPDLAQFVADNDVARDLLVFAASDACHRVRRWYLGG